MRATSMPFGAATASSVTTTTAVNSAVVPILIYAKRVMNTMLFYMIPLIVLS